MVYSIPSHWKYDDSMELLFLFYQISDELLAPNTNDTNRLPLHNTYTLCYELRKLYSYLKQHNLFENFYKGYIPPIIDELIDAIHHDDILKGMLASRLDCIITGLVEAKGNYHLLIRWLDLMEQICSAEQYCDAYKTKIIEYVQNNKDKEKLMAALANFYVSLREIEGYSEEFLYYTLRSYFANSEITVESCSSVIDFLNKFDGMSHEFKLLFLVDDSMAEMYKNIVTISEYSRNFVDIKEISIDELKKWNPNNDALKSFINRHKQEGKAYRFKGRECTKRKLKILQITIDAIDPHYAYENVSGFFSMIHNWECYFRHLPKKKVIFDCLWIKDDNHFIPVKYNRILKSRPNIDATVVLERVNVISDTRYMSRSACRSLIHAFSLHDDAVSSRDENVMLRSFWTASEALFAMPEKDQDRDNVITSYLAVIQKTYILKRLRCVYEALVKCINIKDLRDQTGIVDFASFIKYFASHKASSNEMKKIYSLLGQNSLLRSRLFRLRENLSSSQSIQNILIQHEQKIKWQLYRIYRVRNLNTHAGKSFGDTNHLLNNLHNYFDYVVNYMICKCEHGDYIANVGAVIFEAKQDNILYMEYLKKDQPLNGDNYKKLLFGMDERIADYVFEVYVSSLQESREEIQQLH